MNINLLTRSIRNGIEDVTTTNMATYNNLPTELTDNIFSYLRDGRRQAPHAYCMDKLIEYIDSLMTWNGGFTDEGLEVITGQAELTEYVGYVGTAVEMAFFYPYIEEMGWDEVTNLLDDYREPQSLSWTYALGDMNKKYNKYDKNGRINMMP